MSAQNQSVLASPLVLGVACASIPLLAYVVHEAWRRRRQDEDRSTISSAGGGPLAYETRKAVHEYLQMHFATPDQLFPYADAPKSAVDFPARCALLVERNCEALRNFTDERNPPTALDIGCAVGGATFELSRCGFEAVMGMDYSQAFITAANCMKADGSMPYESVVEGEITESRVAMLPEGVQPDRVRFRVGDACNLPADLAPVDAILAANLICRLPNPRLFLDRLPRLVRRGGVVVLTTPFSWLPSWTPKRNWLGGYVQDGKTVQSFEQLRAVMEGNGFTLKTTEEMPFVIREHARKFQWGCAQGSVWIKG